MNDKLKRIIALFCLFSLIITVFSACKDKNDSDDETVDPFEISEYPASDSSNSEPTTIFVFDDFYSTTAPTSAASSSDSPSSSTTQKPPVYTPTVSVPEVTPSTPPTLPPTVDPNITNTTNGGSKVDVEKLLYAFGYAYDPVEDCFYTEVDAWQRYGGFAPHYDLGAFLINMHYITFQVDFDWGGESWRIQFWKGNYSPIIDGAEIGIYTKPLGASTELYDTADDQHLLNMSLELYKKNPVCDKNRILRRPASDHWWQTGFKLINTSQAAVPGQMVLQATIKFKDAKMAKAFCTSLQQVRGKYAPMKTFREIENVNRLVDDTFVLEDNAVTLRWRAVGYLNYDFPSESITTRNGN